MEFVKNGEIVLNVGQDATRNLKIGNELIQFSARFSGSSREVSVPIGAVAGIFAKENGQGLAFQVGAVAAPANAANKQAPGSGPRDDDHPGPAGGRPKLQVVK